MIKSPELAVHIPIMSGLTPVELGAGALILASILLYARHRRRNFWRQGMSREDQMHIEWLQGRHRRWRDQGPSVDEDLSDLR